MKSPKKILSHTVQRAWQLFTATVPCNVFVYLHRDNFRNVNTEAIYGTELNDDQTRISHLIQINSSFPEIHKVGKVGIFVLFLMEKVANSC